jgi:predicted DNA binding protein
MRKAYSGDGGSSNGKLLGLISGIAGRVLSAKYSAEEDVLEIWIRISGPQEVMDRFEHAMRQEEGIAFQKIFSNKFNTIYRILLKKHKCPCLASGRASCPLLSQKVGAMVKSTIITPRGLLCEFIVARGKFLNELKRDGFQIIFSHDINGFDYMLTYKQELALIYAYLMGYYQFPRKISLKELASRLGLSVSTLAELLRKAEAKVIEAYIRHELPQYLVNVIMSRSACRQHIERMFVEGRNGKNGRNRKSNGTEKTRREEEAAVAVQKTT